MDKNKPSRKKVKHISLTLILMSVILLSGAGLSYSVGGTEYNYTRDITGSNSSLTLPLNLSTTSDIDGNTDNEMLYGVPDANALFYNNDTDTVVGQNGSTEACLYDTLNNRKSCPQKPNGLVSHWTLDENNPQTETWDPINQNNGTHNGANDGTNNGATQNITGIIDKAYDFDGSDDYVETSSMSLDNTDNGLAFCTWINPSFDTTTEDNSIEMRFRPDGSHNTGFGWGQPHGSAGEINFEWSDDGLQYDVPSNWQGTWKHLCFSADDQDPVTLKIYVNGTEVKSGGVSGSQTVTDTGVVYIGSDRGDSSFSNSSIDDVRIYDRALNQSEIEEIYNSSNGTEWGPRDGLVGQWRLNEDSGSTAFDSARFTDGQVNKGYQFDGSDDYVDIGSFSQFSSYSLSVWSKHDSVSDGDLDEIFALYSNNNIVLGDWGDGAFQLHHDGTNIQADVSNNVWNHWVGIWNGTQIFLYKNGVQVNSTSKSTIGTPSKTSDYIGADAADNQRYFNGSIDDVRIYNRSLSATEIEELYNETQPDTDPVLGTKETTGGEGPNAPSDPSPNNGATTVSTTTNLSVNATDPDGDTMNITFYWNNGTQIQKINNVENGSTATTNNLNLNPETTYNWYATANDSTDTTTSPTWNFTTEEAWIPITTTTNGYIGARQDGTYNLNGSIDNTKIHSRTLSDTEIQELYQTDTTLGEEQEENISTTCTEESNYIRDSYTGILLKKESEYTNVYKGATGGPGTAEIALCYPNINLTWQGQCIQGKTAKRTSVLIKKQNITQNGTPIVSIDFC